MGRLLLAEEDWLEKHKHRFQQGPKEGGSGSSSGGYNGGRGSHGGRGGHHRGKALARGENNGGEEVKLTSEGTPRRKGRCRNCNIYGHYEQDYKRPKKEKKKDVKQQEANVAVGDGVHGGVLMLAECDVIDHGDKALQTVHLLEKITPAEVPDGVWVLDTGASNHMTATRSTLTQLDMGVRCTVRFGDGSRVEIEGLGSMVTKDRQNGHKVLTDVYYIPKLKSNIVSLGQLEEKGFAVTLGNGRLCVFDQDGTLLISAPRTTNRMYLAKFGLAPPICLLAQVENQSWLWHGRYGHLNFKASSDLSAKEMVQGMPIIKRGVEQICDGCVLGKQHIIPFPKQSSFRAKNNLELVHADLCGQISPKSLGVLLTSCWW
jgi:hypothetical protein